MNRVNIFREDYKNDYQYKKEIRRYRESGWMVVEVCGGVICFKSDKDYNSWINQKITNIYLQSNPLDQTRVFTL